MSLLSVILTRSSTSDKTTNGATLQISKRLMDIAHCSATDALEMLETEIGGLRHEEAEHRVELYGRNEVATEKHQSTLARLIEICKNPLVVLLIVLASLSLATGDPKGTIVMAVMVILGVSLRFFQEQRADDAAAKLKAMVTTTVTVVREAKEQELPLQALVPGDLIHLSAGDMVPADVRLIACRDLFVNQAALTGEALPVEKSALPEKRKLQNALEVANICFMGTNVESGTATAVVAMTGSATYFGSLASRIVGQRITTSFDKGVDAFTWLMIRFMAVMVPLVFLINGLSKGNWLEAFFFALAVAVGLTPEMLPMIVTVNLSKGALAMSRKKVIVKRLNAIQNFGAMDVLCTDKTGTITQARIILERYLDIHGDESPELLRYAYLNSFYQTGLKNLLDQAVLNHVGTEERETIEENYRKIDEIPFDFVRRRMSVVVEDNDDKHLLICKGAVEEMLSLCTAVEVNGQVTPFDAAKRAEAETLIHDLNEDGFRVIVLAYREIPEAHRTYTLQDEVDLTLVGVLGFLDPPKETAALAIAKLKQHQVQVKILTGDNEIVTGKICKQVGLSADHVLLGGEIDELSDDKLADAADKATVFAKLSPAHKERIIKALQRSGHAVGFMGDGINDAPALKAADVGISVDTAVDIAKESSDIILLENSLTVLEEGVIEGRKVFGNIIKYIKMAASSNFGNMFSVLGASMFLPFLPMLPMQVLTNNLLYDFSQTAIPTDSVDEEWLAKPRKWAISGLSRFILFVGPISSIFDYLTYFIMLYIFNAWNNPALFHTGWFVESLFTQTLIIHVIRTNKIPFIQSRASTPLIITSLVIVCVGAFLTLSPIGEHLGFVPLPLGYWPLLALMLFGYILLTQMVKMKFIRHFEL